ncbi:hypothetical protein TELCIR_18116 [Teladorsagia circumcincta]|uniref:Uncharacterized protein n=1 Tax=Teladorsagia circumcincta TaxID=45464 RepID=A0A2G9TQW3_TELCI|nr:hypothetical protein TELCIR_18116 [Teladorsagia circumcincta]
MKVSRRLEISFVTLKPRLDTNRLTEEKRQLLEKLAADAMAKSPDPCSRQPKDKAASNNDDCLIGPTAPPDTKGSEMQQRKTQLLSLMDAFETPSGAKAAAGAKPVPTSGPTAGATVTAKKRDTTPAPPVGAAGASAAITRPPSSGAQQSQAVSTAKPSTPRQIMTSPITQKDSDLIVSPPPRSDKTLPTAGSRPSSSPQKRATIALIYNCKSTDSQTNGKPCPAPVASSSQTNGKPSPAPAASSNGAAPSKAVETSQRKQSPTTKEIPPPVGQQAPRRTEASSGTSDSGTSSGNTSERTQASVRAPSPAKAKSVEEAAKTAIAATKTPPQPDPKSQNEIIDATERALKNIKPAEPKQ